MKEFLLVAAGGAVGASLRYLTATAVMRISGGLFPWGTFVVNILGCLVMGAFIELLLRWWGGSAELRAFVATGVLGGFTTFSAFSLDFAVLWERGEALQAVAYGMASVGGSVAALFLGLWLVRSFA